jgi:hypothetical protein
LNLSTGRGELSTRRTRVDNDTSHRGSMSTDPFRRRMNFEKEKLAS